MKLTVKQKKFCDEYIRSGGRASHSARFAGYKGNPATIGAIATENLKKPLIQEYLAKRMDKASEKRLDLIGKAVERLEKIVNDDMEETNNVLKAVDIIFKIAGKYTEEQIKISKEKLELEKQRFEFEKQQANNNYEIIDDGYDDGKETAILQGLEKSMLDFTEIIESESIGDDDNV